MKNTKYIFTISFLLTLCIFIVGFMLSYGLDFVRVNEVLSVMDKYDLKIQSFTLERDLYGVDDDKSCILLKNSLRDLRSEIIKVGTDLTNYGSSSIFKKDDFDYLKRKYFLLELSLFGLVKDFNSKCGKSMVLGLYFYDIDDDVSERQGFVLDEVSQGNRDKFIVLSFDIEYKDEPVLNQLIKYYDVKNAPTVIIDDIKFEGITYVGELNNTVLDIFYDRGVDKYAPDFSYTITANGKTKEEYANELLNVNTSDPFTIGDIYLVLGRMMNDSDLICKSLEYYDLVNESNKELKALSYESIASIGCGRNKKAFYLEASKLWEKLGYDFRSKVTNDLALQKELNFNYLEYPLIQEAIVSNSESVIIGDDYFRIKGPLVAQSDRVTRDWLSYQYQNPYSDNILSVFSERLTYNETELMADVGWHEGGRIKDLNLDPVIASGTLIKKFNNKWYASNLGGDFIFEVPKDKLLYPTTRFLKEDLAVIIDTHGINMLVAQSELNNASMVIGCCDNIGKIRAAKYLANKGVNVLCFTDKYLPLLMNQNLSVIGSPIIKDGVVGNQPIKITASDKILAMDVSSTKFSLSYYQTPTIYFKVFNQLYPKFNISFFPISDFNQMSAFIEHAKIVNANVIGIRVFNLDDYTNVKTWLDLDVNNRAILFHSTAYPYGVKLIKEYPHQTTFDDVNFN